MEEKFVIIINEMAEVLNAAQLKRLQEVLVKHLYQEEPLPADTDNLEYLTMFLNAKKIEGMFGTNDSILQSDNTAFLEIDYRTNPQDHYGTDSSVSG